MLAPTLKRTAAVAADALAGCFLNEWNEKNGEIYYAGRASCVGTIIIDETDQLYF